MSSQYTFWRLVEEFKIIVPIIQRDYAQGRKDDLKIEQIRKTFIQHLLEKINQNSHKSDLDFIYGSVVDEQLKLLDGQQRLTTLYLLEKYLGLVFAKEALRFEAREKSNRTLSYVNDLNNPEKITKIT